jgi:hypothetical protein
MVVLKTCSKSKNYILNAPPPPPMPPPSLLFKKMDTWFLFSKLTSCIMPIGKKINIFFYTNEKKLCKKVLGQLWLEVGFLIWFFFSRYG